MNPLVRAATDPAGASWIAPRLLAWWSLPDGCMPAGAIIPTGFERYVRVLHPAERTTPSGPVGLRWEEFAARKGVLVKPDTLWEDIVADDEKGAITPPSEGHLPGEEASAIVEVLATSTSSPEDCWFAVWEGYGALNPEQRWPGAARLVLPNREYVLLRGPIGAAVHSFEPPPFQQSANLWWPEDRAWCVATEIDYSWTYVGGSSACIQQLLADSRLEAIPIRADDRAAGCRPSSS